MLKYTNKDLSRLWTCEYTKDDVFLYTWNYPNFKDYFLIADKDSMIIKIAVERCGFLLTCFS